MQNLPPLRAVELTEAHNSGFRPHQLSILQQPVIGRVTKSPPGLLCIDDSKSSTAKTKGLYPLEPQLTVAYTLNDDDTMQFHRQSPYIFGMVTLESLDPEQPLKPNTFAGSVTSSLNKWRMPDGGEQCVFVFNNLFIRYPGVYRLRCHSFEMRQGQVEPHPLSDVSHTDRVNSCSGLYAAKLAEIYGDVLRVGVDKAAAPTRASTKLTQDLHDQGVKLKLKKGNNRKRTSPTVVWTADGASGNFVAGNNAVNHPTYKALPGQTGAMAPALNNGEDVSGRLSFSRGSNGAMAPALNNGEDVSGRLSFSRGSNGAIAPAPAPALSHIPDMSHRMAYHDMNNDAGHAWNAGTFSALQPVYPQYSNMYAAVQPPNMLNFGGQVPIMSTGAEASATFGTGMLDGFGFDNHLSSYWVQQNWTL
ncbi:hypothetical protein LTR99_008069 [Exophiala xenobiotica]|uniref:Velvet domain-containing protein n=1 Tax=Vermiconidia calcicola TaxID=1690605 RepID=A0AAV9QGA1_9PEZI|nr:hypothetical protein LTR92_003666 [Exophiala xenobiotica]KAK5543389.1 hypothetical protein LTR25_001002 [Vermiconidia calcicola]KAK5544314.1 hypothetical protein LTR23_004693 [Chaetothyriales sp. CCFEE 6169]KAK5266072.1 hypothetical protein LTR96_008466 [Exophiala xenobiotica]KAK5297667.1 hypothetical protein LTR99_008069 [Exophiala xenobiotica]